MVSSGGTHSFEDDVRQMLSNAAAIELDFVKDAEPYVRYMLGEFKTRFENDADPWDSFAPRFSVLVARGEGQRKAVQAFEFEEKHYKRWGKGSTERQSLMREMGEKYAKGVEGVPLLVFWESENWGTDNPAFDGSIPLSEFPDKFEEVSVVATAFDGRTVRGSLKIKRGKNNRILPDGEIEILSSINLPENVLSLQDALAKNFFNGWVAGMANALANARVYTSPPPPATKGSKKYRHH